MVIKYEYFCIAYNIYQRVSTMEEWDTYQVRHLWLKCLRRLTSSLAANCIHGPLLLWKEQWLILTRSDMIFPFCANGDSASNTVQELIQSRITLLRPRDRNTYFKGEEAVGKWPYDPLVLAHSVPSRSCWPDRGMEWFLKAQLGLQVGDSTMWWRGIFL